MSLSLQALATFFGVDGACFLFPAAEPQPALAEELRQALAQPLVADPALRAAQLPEDERARVLQRLERSPADRHQRKTSHARMRGVLYGTSVIRGPTYYHLTTERIRCCAR